MPSVQSKESSKLLTNLKLIKILGKLLNFQSELTSNFNCYELGHTWEPSCTANALDIGLVVFYEALKLYAPLYIGSHILIRRKYDRKSLINMIKDILRSSTFLG